jgi:Surface-adhesin protein E
MAGSTVQKFVLKGLVATMACVLVSCKPKPVSEWVVFESAPEATIYVDPSTLHREGDRAEMWVLIDYRQPLPDKTGKQVLSDKLHYQYDCKNRQYSIVDTSAHAGPMATGELINVNPDPPEVVPVPPGTTAEEMWKHACGG